MGLNHPMGPFELVDLVGLDTRLHILEYLLKTLGEKYRPLPLLVQYVKAGRLGRKAGRGVFNVFLNRRRDRRFKIVDGRWSLAASCKRWRLTTNH